MQLKNSSNVVQYNYAKSETGFFFSRRTFQPFIDRINEHDIMYINYSSFKIREFHLDINQRLRNSMVMEGRGSKNCKKYNMNNIP